MSESKPPVLNRKTITTASGRQYTLKRPTIGESLTITNLQARLLGGLDVEKVDPVGRSLATALATVKVIVVEPQNHDFENTTDYDELLDVYTQYDEWITEFFRPVKSSGSEGTGEE